MYDKLSPNDHVNMGQSTNDTYPTACHIAIDRSAERLLLVVSDLEAELLAKSVQFADLAKPGRTHMMDALPVTLGQEFGAYAMAMQRARERISRSRVDLLELPIGGTAVGTGANSHPEFRALVLDILSKRCGRPFRPARNGFEALQSRSQMAAHSSSLKELAIELVRIANDLRLLSSGPTTGLGEIDLPAVQPGSSIMPGKVNPVLAECLDMVCFQIIGNDTAVTMAAQAGQLELNVMTPLMVHNILSSQEMLINYLPVFTARCIVDLSADAEKCRKMAMKEPILATLLNQRIGYMRAADVVDEALRTGEEIPAIAVRKGYITEAEAKEMFDLKAMTRPRYQKEG
jgi:aspartate ammonia-lyase